MSLYLILWTLAPGLLWLSWLLKRDKFEPEPFQLIALAFGLGMLITYPAGLINEAALHSQAFANLFENVDSASGIASIGLPGYAVASFGIIGPTEELLKFSIVYYFFFHHKEFDEPIDGLIYAGSVALGFATAENFLYVRNYGPEVLLVRGLCTVPAHFLFASSFGYAMGIKKGLASPNSKGIVASTAQSDAERKNIPHPHRGPSLRQGVLWAIAAHGAYDFSVFSGAALNQPLLAWGGVLLILTALAMKWKTQVETLASYSQFKNSNPRYPIR